jgi:hypothetical protein
LRDANTYRKPEDFRFAEKERMPSQESIQELSTLIVPNIAGVNPKYLDPRLIAEAANVVRSIAQVTNDRYFLFAMGLDEDRI